MKKFKELREMRAGEGKAHELSWHQQSSGGATRPLPGHPLHTSSNDELHALKNFHASKAREVGRSDWRKSAKHSEAADHAHQILSWRSTPVHEGLEESPRDTSNLEENTYFSKRKQEKEAELRTPTKKIRPVKTNSYFATRKKQVDEAQSPHTIHLVHGTAQTYDKATEKWDVIHAQFNASGKTAKHALNRALKYMQKKHPHHAEYEVSLKESTWETYKQKAVNEAKLHMPLKGHAYHYKSNEELHYIIKDASEAEQAAAPHDKKAMWKYGDQQNDAGTVLGYRQRGGKQIPHQIGVHRPEHVVKESTWAPAQGHVFHSKTNDELRRLEKLHTEKAKEERRFDPRSHSAHQSQTHADIARAILNHRATSRNRDMKESLELAPKEPHIYDIYHQGEHLATKTYKTHKTPEQVKATIHPTYQKTAVIKKRTVNLNEADLKAQWNTDFTKDSYARRKNLRQTIKQQLNPKTPGLGNKAWNRADKQEKENRKSTVSASLHEAYKVGDHVVPKIGPHAGQVHRVIHVHPTGHVNITPARPGKNSYHQGAAKASPTDLEDAPGHGSKKLDESVDAYKVGDKVVPKIGPHKGTVHSVIHVHPTGHLNITPDVHVSKNKYHLGATKADPKDVARHLAESAMTSSQGMSFDQVIAHATKHGGKIVFGTNSQKWHSITPQDRDYNMPHASHPKDAQQVGEKQAKWGVRSVARAIVNRKTVQEAFASAKDKKNPFDKKTDSAPADGANAPNEEKPTAPAPQPQDGGPPQPGAEKKSNTPTPERKTGKLEVKGAGPDDKFQESPIVTILTTLPNSSPKSGSQGVR